MEATDSVHLHIKKGTADEAFQITALKGDSCQRRQSTNTTLTTSIAEIIVSLLVLLIRIRGV